MLLNSKELRIPKKHFVQIWRCIINTNLKHARINTAIKLDTVDMVKEALSQFPLPLPF